MGKIIGLTGTIGSGKSVVTSILKKHGYEVLDADDVSRETASRKEVLDEIRASFGDVVMNDDGTLDRKKVSDIVYSSSEKRRKLESIITRRVLERAADIASDFRNGHQNDDGILFIDAPLLFETGSDRLCDFVWVVTCDNETRIGRIMERDGSSREEVLRKISAQMSENEKIKKADVVINNDGTVEELEKKIAELLKN